MKIDLYSTLQLKKKKEPSFKIYVFSPIFREILENHPTSSIQSTSPASPHLFHLQLRGRLHDDLFVAGNRQLLSLIFVDIPKKSSVDTIKDKIVVEI